MPALRNFLNTCLDWHKAKHPTTHNEAKSEVRIIVAKLEHRPIDTLRLIELDAYKTRRLVTGKRAPETGGPGQPPALHAARRDPARRADAAGTRERGGRPPADREQPRKGWSRPHQIGR